jgi:hypothetical protein
MGGNGSKRLRLCSGGAILSSRSKERTRLVRTVQKNVDFAAAVTTSAETEVDIS